MDIFFICVIVVAGIIGWIACDRNRYVNWFWKALSIFAFPLLIGAAWMGMQDTQLVWWTHATIDKITLGVALLPILAWPVRKRGEKTVTVSAGATAQ